MKLGIIGTGRIADRFVSECQFVNDLELATVYNTHIESARSFVERLNLDALACDDLQELFRNSEIIYIATPHETHYGYAKEALLAGKHVLCEKPMALSGQEALDLFETAKADNLIIMEAIKTAYCQGFGVIQQLVEDGAIGQVYDVEATFTKIGTASGREMWGPAGGSFVELGSYTLLPVVKLLGVNSRESYIWSLNSPTGNDSYTKTVVAYDGACATLKTGLGVKSEGELIIAGESGYIRVPSPWWLTQTIEVHHEDPNRVETYNALFEGPGLRYEIREFVNKVSYMESMKDADINEDISSEEVWNELMSSSSITPQESIWMASQIEIYLNYREQENGGTVNPQCDDVGIWAHRGCSYKYPENTLLAFEEAAKVSGIRGIEFDVQRSSDGQLVVIYDETVDRTTNGSGKVCDMTLAQLKGLKITPSGCQEIYEEHSVEIPSLEEAFSLLKPYCQRDGLLLNIELKNSVEAYEGMEEDVMAMVSEFGLEDYVVYSSFNHQSMARVKEINPKAQTGALAGNELDCLEGMERYGLDALHPSCNGMLLNEDSVNRIRQAEIPVRMYTGIQPLFGQDKAMPDIDLRRYVLLGATDIIVNNPEDYL